MANLTAEQRAERKANAMELNNAGKKNAPVRRKRKPLGVPASKMAVAPRKGYHRHWINDVGGRIANAIEGGYEHVMRKDVSVSGEAQQGQGTKVSQIVGTKEEGGPLYAYLMEIKQEWYDEDQREKQKPVDETEKAIREGSLENGLKQHEKYAPDGGIKMS